MTYTALQVVERDIASLRPYARNARTHSKKQIKQIAASVERFGFTNPVHVSDDGEIIAGHCRVEAAKLINWKTVPTLALSHLSEAERRAYVLTDNKLALNAGWDREILAIELQALVDLDFGIEVTGFSLAEVDFALVDARGADPSLTDAPEDAVPEAADIPVSWTGDLWQLGRHRLLCGDTHDVAFMGELMQDEVADLVFTDPPYKVAIDGNVCGLGCVKHREFAFASGEMSKSQFTRFLAERLGNMSRVLRNSAIAFVCMDWRHMGELFAAERAIALRGSARRFSSSPKTFERRQFRMTEATPRRGSECRYSVAREIANALQIISLSKAGSSRLARSIPTQLALLAAGLKSATILEKS